MGVRGPWPQLPLEAESVRPVATREPPVVTRRTERISPTVTIC